MNQRVCIYFRSYDIQYILYLFVLYGNIPFKERTISDFSVAGSDYELLSISLSYTSADRVMEQCYPLTILEDELVEAEETLSVALTDSVNLNILAPSSITVTIQRNQVNVDSKYATVQGYYFCVYFMQNVRIKFVCIKST